MKNQEIKIEEMKNAGYFFHPGGSLQGATDLPKTRGIWRSVESPLKAVHVGNSWADAWEDYERNFGWE